MISGIKRAEHESSTGKDAHQKDIICCFLHGASFDLDHRKWHFSVLELKRSLLTGAFLLIIIKIIAKSPKNVAFFDQGETKHRHNRTVFG